MGAELLLLPALFALICTSFIVVSHLYRKWKMKEVLRQKREIAKISLVNILQLTNSNLTTPSWLKQNDNGKATKEDPDLPPYGKLKSLEASQTTNLSLGQMDPRSPNVLSSVVTLREDQDSPPPYEDVCNCEKSQAPSATPRKSIIFSYHHSSGTIGMSTVPAPKSESVVMPSTFKSTTAQKEELGIHNKNSTTTFINESCCPVYSESNSCYLQIPKESTVLEPDPSLERRNSSAVLYL